MSEQQPHFNVPLESFLQGFSLTLYHSHGEEMRVRLLPTPGHVGGRFISLTCPECGCIIEACAGEYDQGRMV